MQKCSSLTLASSFIRDSPQRISNYRSSRNGRSYFYYNQQLLDVGCKNLEIHQMTTKIIQETLCCSNDCLEFCSPHRGVVEIAQSIQDKVIFPVSWTEEGYKPNKYNGNENQTFCLTFKQMHLWFFFNACSNFPSQALIFRRADQNKPVEHTLFSKYCQNRCSGIKMEIYSNKRISIS